MAKIKNAICWATVIVVVAAAGRAGVIDKSSAVTLLLVLPVAGWMALTGRTPCGLRREA